MSDFTIAATPPAYDPFSPLAKMAQIAQVNTATQGGQIANQGAQLGLALQQARLAPFLGLGGQPSGQSGGLGSMAAPGMGGTATPAGSFGGAGASDGGGQPSLPGDVGERIYGFAMPPLQAMSLAGEKDPATALKDIADTRRQLLYSAAANSSDPQSWNAGIASLAQQGWLSSTSAKGLYGRFDLQPRVLQSLASPDENLKYTGELSGQGLAIGSNGSPQVSGAAVAAKGAVAGAEATGRNASDLTYKPQIDQAENAPLAQRAGMTTAATLPYDVEKAQAAPYNIAPGETRIVPAIPGQPSKGADLLAAGAIPPAVYANRVTGSENPTGDPNAKNPNSSAKGNGQFLDQTWLQTMRQSRPDLAGQSDQQLLAMRGKPEMAQQATIAYAQQNAPILQQAGIPVTSASLGMAHRLGPQGAVTVLTSPAGAALSSVLPANVIATNPDLARQTVGAFVQNSKAKYGNDIVAFGGAGAVPGGTQPVAARGGPSPSSILHADETFPPASGAAPPATPATPAAQAPSIGVPAPPALGGSPVVTPLPSGGTAVQSPISPVDLARQKAQADNDVTQMGDYRKTLLEKSQNAVQNNAVLNQMLDESGDFTMGWGADAKNYAKSVLDGVAKTFGIPEDQSFSEAIGSQQAFNKNAGQLARTAAREVGSRTGAQELQMIQKTLPSDEMSSQGFQRVTTQLGGLNDYAIAKSAAAAQASAGNPNGFEATWNQNVSPTAFIINRMPQADLTTLHAKLMETPEGKQTWQNIKAQVSYAQQNGLFSYVR